MKKLLALLLTLCLVIGMVPLAASAEGENVAKIGEKEYPSLLEAVKNVKEGETIELLKDVQDGVGIATYTNASEGQIPSKSFTIDFKGFTYNFAKEPVGSSGTESQGFHFEWKGQGQNNVNITLKNGTLTTNAPSSFRMLIQNYCNLTLENMTLDGSNMSNGDYVVSNNCGNVKISGETSITAGNNGVAFDVCGYGNYTTGVSVEVNTTGTITGEIEITNSKDYDIGLTITSGSFNGKIDNQCSREKAKVSISGGEFSEPVNPEYCADDMAPLVMDNGKCVIKKTNELTKYSKDENGVYYDNDAAEKKFEATVTTAKGTKGYATLEKALEAAQSSDMITLLKDVTISGEAGNTQGILTIEKDITIDGQNHRITAEDTVTKNSSMINIQNGAKVTIKNVKIDSKNTKHGLNTYTAPDATEKTTVTLENVEIKNGTGYGIVANNTVVNATNLTTIGNGWGGVNVDKGAQVTVGGASNLGEESSIVYENATTDTNGKKGSLTVNGGTYKNIVVQAAESTDEIVGTVSLTGGTFNGVVAKGEGTTNPTTIVDITGGKFAQTAAGDVGGEGAGEYVAIKDLIPEDYEISSDGTVKEEEPYVPPVIPTYKTTVEECEGGSVVASPSSAREGQKVTLTVKPQAGQELKSLKVTDKDGDAVTLTKVEGGYTFNMPKGGVTVTAVFGCDGGAACPSKGFTDVDSEKWYHEYMDYAVEKGLLEGTSPTTMEPNATLTRAQLAQILYNLEGKPQVQGDLDFTDVAEGKWYYAAILWANQEGVVDGMSPDTFAPNEDISRQDLALMLYRYAGEPTVTGDLDGFKDAGQVGDWAEEAITWAVEEGIIDGMTPTTLEPTGTATRAQAAAMLQRFLEG